MAVIHLAALVLVLSLVHDVRATADVALDADCTYGTDTCVTDTVCDQTLGKCEYKSGVTCTTVGKCVTGATCTVNTDQCVCTTASGYEARTDGYCGLIFGKNCTSKTPCVDNAECTASGKCACKSGYYAKADGICYANIAIDATCVYGTDTCVTGAVCDQTLNKCEYKSGVTCATVGKCVTGATCTANTDPCVCTTASGYVARTDGYCGLISGKTCVSATPCVDNAECTASGMCACKSGYTTKTDGTCSAGAVGLVGSFVLLMAAVFTATRLR